MIGTISDMNNLYDGFRASMKGSSWKTEPQRFEEDFLHQINKLSKEIQSRNYKTSRGSEFILNERGHLRYIHGGTIRDRTVRHALCDVVLNPRLKPYLIYNNGASQKGKGIQFSRKIFERDLHNFYLEYGDNDGYIGFVDLSKFYDNIQHDKVKMSVYPIIKDDEEANWVLSEVLHSFEVDVSYLSDEEFKNCMDEKFNSIDYHKAKEKIKNPGKKMMKKSVDIGDQVSQDIGVFFPTYIDNYVKIVLRRKRYGRYMDDMYVICRTREEVKETIDSIVSCAKEIGLFVNFKKTHIVKLSDRFTFLQIKYFLTDYGKVVKRISPKTITRERRKLKAYKRLLDKNLIEYEDIKQAYKSWIGCFVPLMSKKQVKNIKNLYYELFREDVRWKKD